MQVKIQYNFSIDSWDICGRLKGLVHPKMKMKSLITHPHAVPIPKSLFLFYSCFIDSHY